MATFFSGKDGKITMDTTDLCIKNWSLEESGDDADTTNSCSGGVKTSIETNTQYNVSFEASMDSDDYPYDILTRGSTGSAKLYLTATDFITIPIRVKTLTTNSDVTSDTTYAVTAEGTAAPTYPS